MEVRQFTPRDVDQIARLFHDTVRQVNSCDYSEQQTQAWAPDDLYFRDWAAVCANRYTYVADDGGKIAGFAELEPNGHIDCFYCHKQYQRHGVGKQLYQAIEAKAVELNLLRLFVESSITAQPFFQRMGFSVVQEQQVFYRGESFVNFKMEKWLTMMNP
uniref:GNAT family N-acetyltransferase n=1 Tax=Oscillatoriales cyanobacterium SpSt-402 TaxID=2282168 RepID=A0A832M268_9CYAN